MSGNQVRLLGQTVRSNCQVRLSGQVRVSGHARLYLRVARVNQLVWIASCKPVDGHSAPHREEHHQQQQTDDVSAGPALALRPLVGGIIVHLVLGLLLVSATHSDSLYLELLQDLRLGSKQSAVRLNIHHLPVTSPQTLNHLGGRNLQPAGHCKSGHDILGYLASN